MNADQLDQLKQWIQAKVEESKNDNSGTNDYHFGREGAFEAVLDYLEEVK